MSEFKIGPLNHVGVAVPDLAEACETYRTLYGATDITTPFDMPEQGVKVCFVNLPNSQIELIEPLNEDSRSITSSRKTRRADSTMSALKWMTSMKPSKRWASAAQPCSASLASVPTAR